MLYEIKGKTSEPDCVTALCRQIYGILKIGAKKDGATGQPKKEKKKAFINWKKTNYAHHQSWYFVPILNLLNLTVSRVLV